MTRGNITYPRRPSVAPASIIEGAKRGRSRKCDQETKEEYGTQHCRSQSCSMSLNNRLGSPFTILGRGRILRIQTLQLIKAMAKSILISP